MRKVYPEETRTTVLSGITNGESVASLSDEYGVSRATIYLWIKQYEELASCKYAKKPRVTQKDYYDLLRHAMKLEKIVSATKELNLSSMLLLEEKMELFYEYQEKYSAKVLCEVLGISRGTYSNRIVNQKDPVFWPEHRAEIEKRVIEIFDKSQQRFGADKILATLQKEGMHTSKQMVRSIMKQHGIQSIGVNAKKDYLKEVKEKRNVIKRRFDVDAPNKVWVGDITQFWWNDEKYYVCAVLDLFSRKVVGHRISKSSSTRFVTSTLRDAFEQRGKPQGLIFHSDRGAQYTSHTYIDLLKNYGITQSFSRSGSPYDNAVIESFFNILKREELHRRSYRTEKELKTGINDYIYFYNNNRPHRYNNYTSPDDTEKAYEESK